MSSAVSPFSDTASLRFKRLRFGVLTLGMLVILAFTVSSAYDSWRSYHRAIAATDREIGNLANALAEQTAWTFRAVDLLLIDAAQWYSSDGRNSPPERINEILANKSAGVKQVSLMTIIDARGTQRHRSRGALPPNLNVSDRSYFIAQRDGAAHGLFMSEPLVTRSENRAAVELSRRLDDENGAFAGVVTAIMNLDDIKQFYRAVNLGVGTAVQLVRDDGTLLVRNPPALEAVGRQFPELAAAETSSAGLRLVNPIDGKSDFIAIAPVRDVPLRLTVTREAAVALQPWREETTRVAIRTIIFVLLGTLTLAALLRQLRRVAAGERALRESEERYALAMEGANEGHWDWDVAADRLFLSPRMRMLYGARPDSVIDSRSTWLAQIVIHPDDMEHFETAIRDHLSGRTARYESEYRVRHSNGDWHWLRGRGRCLRDAAGNPIRFVGSSTDITAQKQSQADKEQLEGQLRQSHKMEAIGTLAGGIAHDFNNILGAILGYGELAHQNSAEGSSLRRYLDNVMHAAERAKLLVEGILGFSRSGFGEREPVNIRSVVSETLELLGASLPAGIELESQIDTGNVAVIGDATYLHQVAMNLCTNAIQAMAHGGLLSVILECIEVSESRVLSRGSLVPGPYVRLMVSDTGVGIPPAVLERMFDPFFTTKSVGEGTGLGLSLVHGIVTDLGGAIGVTTKAGRGTRFEIWLPVAGEVSAPVVEKDRILPRGKGESIMIVDDEPALVELAEEITAGLGYEPVGFASSRAALHAFQAAPQRFDVVLTDESMPDLPGTELAREIWRIRPTVPIIVMTGYLGSQLTNKAAEIGVNALLRKPLHSRDLAESLARVLQSMPPP
ncbi:MAG TPA: ATP-binding protein [Steroidobacteraceae bacterium]